MKKIAGIEAWSKEKHYKAFDIVEHDEQSTGIEYYISIAGDQKTMLCDGGIHVSENIGNNPSVSPVYWSLLKEIN